ncbi:MAG: ImmA/IrrE family metallo-endopeptidase [Chloroflexi bacterium]|nr:ImmA/IrrE family metallo-endopeptidase [Chloroflexota bacterium]MBP8054517.1 ImmA/IrrE family metallo-endopeptidase [Chloroflexota bacterium]
MSTELVNIIFGMKVRQARIEAGLSLTEYAELCELSPSYVTEIEKGKKYPRPNKIRKMAEVLGKEYDEMVSIKLDSSLTYLERALASPLVHRFPFDEFGLEASDLVSLLTRAPDKASALLHTALEIGRQYDLKQEHFFRAMLRSYQEIHENYFEELEDAAANFAQEHGIDRHQLLHLAELEGILHEKYGYTLDRINLAENPALAGYRSVYVKKKRPRLLLNPSLHPWQLKFLLARELGYQYLGLQERSTVSTPDEVGSFAQVYNDFQASYFGGAILMPPGPIIERLHTFFSLSHWSPETLRHMLTQFEVTPEMLLYRFCELIPQFFGLKIHFLRFHNVGGRYRLTKQLNLNEIRLPSGLSLREHYCRRWLTVRLLRELEGDENAAAFSDTFHIDVQISEYLDSHEKFMCLGFARPLVLSPHLGSSVTLGFRMDSDLEKTIKFLHDPTIHHTIISETCERCPLTEEQCHLRAAEPVLYRQEEQKKARQQAVSQLIARLQA